MFSKGLAFITVGRETNLQEWIWVKSFKNVVTEAHSFLHFSCLRFSLIGMHRPNKRRLLNTEIKIVLYKEPEVYWCGRGNPNVSNHYREVHKLTPAGSQLASWLLNKTSYNSVCIYPGFAKSKWKQCFCSIPSRFFFSSTKMGLQDQIRFWHD